MTDYPQMSDGLQNSISEIISWYGDVLPRKLDKVIFPTFAIRSREFAHRIVNNVPILIDHKGETAYTDGKTIWLPAMYFMPKFYEFLGIEPKFRTAAACLLINGIQIHEALHCLLSVFGMDKFVEGNEVATEYIERYKGFGACLNIIEDTFIEAYCRDYFYQLTSFINGYSHLLFSDYHLDRHIASIEAKGTMSLDDILGLVAFTKALNQVGNPKLAPVEKLAEIVDRARDSMLSVGERVELAVELFEAIMEEGGGEDESEENEQSDFLQKPGGTPQLFDGADTNDGICDDPSSLGAGKPSAKALAETFMDALNDAIAEMEVEAAEAAKAAKDEKEKQKAQERNEPPKSRDIFKTVPPTIIRDILSISSDSSTDSVHPSRKWLQFGSYLRYARQLKTVIGSPTDHGGRLVKSRLHRIATDGKILARRDYKQIKRGKPEVIILIDASGSMNSRYNGSGITLFVATVEAAYGMYEALMRAGIPVAVYAHTSPSHSRGLAPLIIPVTAFRMPVMGSHAVTHGNHNIRFNRLAGINLVENFDGFAIETVSTQFTKTEGSKLLVVLSDGSPSAGHMYGGKGAQDHTKDMVNRARKNGVSVFSVSLVPNVVGTNNEIYGADYNLQGFAANLEKSLQALASRIALQ